ncbi:hypothetical protein LX32DRAFT_638666 [Colletotrichum zoysiae]|uniref:Protein kinase domain-containing protein n=1 Tax=Colletotrichum zoysiae TaxID=1216348 RepID=A0AAD9M0V9_9PEZI|nr:hypothetical protein LX32DRAFT_638666 [Colletotrichum zoysiae]
MLPPATSLVGLLLCSSSLPAPSRSIFLRTTANQLDTRLFIATVPQVPLSTVPPRDCRMDLKPFSDPARLPRYNDHHLRFKWGIRAEADHTTYLHQEIQRYAPGQALTLYPRDPGTPYGLYDLPPLPAAEANLAEGQIRNFEPAAEFTSAELAHLEILEVIKGGISVGAQLLLCKVLQAPARAQPEGIRSSYKAFNPDLKVVLKVFDPIFFPRPGERDVVHRNISNNEWADRLLSREANALRHLYSKGLTGHPYLAPQYHGSWALRFDIGHSSRRCVGAVLMEYIEGASIESMCDVKIVYEGLNDASSTPARGRTMLPEPNKMRFIVPNETAFVRFPSSRDGKSGVSFGDLSARVRVFRTLLDGCVSVLHAGAELNSLLERDIFITLGNNGVDLEEPRVVFLDYTFSVVWSDTLSSKMGRADEYDSLFPKVPSSYLLDVHPLERLPRPPHPAWKYGDIGYFDHFSGWIPPEWIRCPRPCEGCQTGRESLCKKPFGDWLMQEFGAVNDRSGRYSSPDDLEQVLRKAAADAKRRYLEEFPGKVEADLERGDRALMRWPWVEKARLRMEATTRKAMEMSARYSRYFRQLSEERRLQQAATEGEGKVQ